MDYIKPPLPEGTSREEIGQRLRLTRKALGLTPTAICSELGIRRSTWSMDEAGKALPNTFDMIRFCERYGASLDWIFRGRISGVSYDLATKIRQLTKEISEEK